MFDEQALNQFYAEISAPEGMDVVAFQARLDSLFLDERSEVNIANYRLGKKPWKKLRDEVVPVSEFLKFKNIRQGQVCFPLDNSTPDCWLLTSNSKSMGIEVTIERGRERFYLATELNRNGIGRGFVGLQDHESKTDFEKRMSRARTMFTTEQALEAAKKGICKCLSRKNGDRYKGVFYLLIQAHLISLPKARWRAIKPELSEQANSLQFQEVYVIGDSYKIPWGFQIK